MGERLVMLPPADVVVRDEFNPRSVVAETDQQELVASIRELGVIDPITCEEHAGEIRVVDGHRRLAAAVELGLAEVPVVVRSDGDDADLARALVLNLRRAGLNPIDEARGLHALTEQGRSHQQVAQLVGCSPEHVSSRIRLLRLPPDVQDGLASRDVPVTAARTLERIADVSPAVAGAVGAALASGDLTAVDLDRNPAQSINEAVDEAGTEAPFMMRFGEGVSAFGGGSAEQLNDHGFARDRFGDLYDAVERWYPLAKARYGAIRITDDDIDAARAYGCLLEIDDADRWRTVQAIVDARFAADRLQLHADRERERLEHAAAKAAKAAGVDPAAPGEDVEKARRKAERAQAEKDRRSAGIVNTAIGAGSWPVFASKDPLTLDEVKLLAVLVLDEWKDTIAQGARLCDARFRREETRETKSGPVSKTTYQDRGQVLEEVTGWMLDARTPQEAARRVLGPLLQGWLADQNAVSQSDRRGVAMPGMYYRSDPAVATVPGLVAALIEGWAPPQVTDALADKIQARDEAAAQIVDISEVEAA